MSLGEKLRNLRLKTKRTLGDQSKLLRVSMNSIYRWEHDLAVPRRPALKLMADYFGVPLDWLTSEHSATALTNESEQNLLSMFRKLPDTTRYKVLGYVERICVEEETNKYLYKRYSHVDSNQTNGNSNSNSTDDTIHFDINTGSR